MDEQMWRWQQRQLRKRRAVCDRGFLIGGPHPQIRREHLREHRSRLKKHSEPLPSARRCAEPQRHHGKTLQILITPPHPGESLRCNNRGKVKLFLHCDEEEENSDYAIFILDKK